MTTRPSNLAESTRNKENVPFRQPLISRHGPSPSPSPSPSPVGQVQRDRGFRPSLVKSPDKQPDFWTDSYLADNVTGTSLIPSPLPASNAALSKPRRKVKTTKSGHDFPARPRHRQTQSELPSAHLPSFRRSHTQPLARGTSPIRITGLSTPPRSRDGSFVSSPVDVLSSPPPALTETYTRIDQEEDLAQTERLSDSSSDDGLANSLRPPHKKSSELLQRIQPSAGSTPTAQSRPDHQFLPRDDAITTASVFSDPTGMSFVDQFSDPGLRSAMTPHLNESAADRDALRKAWSSKKAVAFAKAKNVLLETDQVADTVSSSPILPTNRLVAFTKAAKVKLASDRLLQSNHQRTFSDVTDKFDRRHPATGESIYNDNWRNDDLRREAMPHNPRLHRQPYFEKNHGFPRRVPKEDEQPVQREELRSNLLRKARSASPFTMTNAPDVHAPGLAVGGDRPSKPGQVGPLSQMQTTSLHTRSTDDLTRNNETASDIWLHPADKPLPSIETQHATHTSNQPFEALHIHSSPEKSRRFDIDFTGTSFQVSESPPVRSKSSAHDAIREKEMRGLAQQAVTTNRLTQLRARESQESLRHRAKSPLADRPEQSSGESLPEPSAVIHKTTSNSSLGSSHSAPIRLTPDRSRSHDILQRLARGSSSTPRSNAPSDGTINGTIVGVDVQPIASRRERHSFGAVVEAGQTVAGTDRSYRTNAVEATPKVVGAWTDTILPDTVKPTKRPGQYSRHVQTPHVSAGGWIETPAQALQNGKLEPVQEVTQEVTQEVPDELMEGIAGNSSSAATDIVTQPGSASAPEHVPSLAKEVLDRAKQRNQREDPARPDPEDSLNLGNTTIQSLADLMDLDETQISAIRFDESETAGLGKLIDRLSLLQTRLADTRRDITNVEHQMSQTPQADTIVRQPEISVQSAGSFPLALLAVYLPIPILYRKQPNSRIPELTKAGWVCLSIWLWYILECTLAEVYSHPLYATHYAWPNEPEPVFPFVLPTMLYRWSRLDFLHHAIIRPLQNLFVGLIRLFGMCFGLTDGYTDGPAARIAGDGLELALNQPVEGLGLDMDEYL